MDFKATQEQITKALIATTRAATRINGADVPFQRSLNPAAGAALDKQNARLLQLARRLLENAATGSDAVGPDLPNVEALDEDDKWRGFVDVIDSLLEKADTSLDEYSGVVKRLSPAVEQVRSIAHEHPLAANRYRLPLLPLQSLVPTLPLRRANTTPSRSSCSSMCRRTMRRAASGPF